MALNWKDEWENIVENEENKEKRTEYTWWSPKPDKMYFVKILKEGDEYKFNADGKVKDRLRFEVKEIETSDKKLAKESADRLDKQETMNWGVNKSLYKDSIYGQLAVVGAKEGTLEDKIFLVSVTTEERPNQKPLNKYQIVLRTL